MALLRRFALVALLLASAAPSSLAQSAPEAGETASAVVPSDETPKLQAKITALETALAEREATIKLQRAAETALQQAFDAELSQAKTLRAQLDEVHAAQKECMAPEDTAKDAATISALESALLTTKEHETALAAELKAAKERTASVVEATAKSAAALRSLQGEKEAVQAELKKTKAHEAELFKTVAELEKSLKAANAKAAKLGGGDAARKGPTFEQLTADAKILAQQTKDDAAAWARATYAAVEERARPAVDAVRPWVAAAAKGAMTAGMAAKRASEPLWEKTAPARSQAWEAVEPTLMAAWEKCELPLMAGKDFATKTAAEAAAAAEEARAKAETAYYTAYAMAEEQVGAKNAHIGSRVLWALMGLFFLKLFGRPLLYVVSTLLGLALRLVLLPFRLVWAFLSFPFGSGGKKGGRPAASGAGAKAGTATPAKLAAGYTANTGTGIRRDSGGGARSARKGK